MKNWAAFIIPLLTSISDYEMYLPEYLMKYVDSEKLTVVMATHNNELANKCNKEIRLA